MRLHRFIGNFDFSSPQIEAADAGLAHQLGTVFRLEEGDSVILCDGAGKQATASIIGIKKNLVSFRLSGEIEFCPVPPRQVVLHAAILRRENFELIVQKAVECGVMRIVPLITNRTVKQSLRLDRLQKIAQEAAEQCGRGTVPEISEPLSLDDALNATTKDSVRAFCDFGGVAATAIFTGAADINLFVGPEGGWDDQERQIAEKQGCHILDLGNLTLRGETAAIVGSWLAVNLP